MVHYVQSVDDRTATHVQGIIRSFRIMLSLNCAAERELNEGVTANDLKEEGCHFKKVTKARSA
jgi:hypothetical protein